MRYDVILIWALCVLYAHILPALSELTGSTSMPNARQVEAPINESALYGPVDYNGISWEDMWKNATSDLSPPSQWYFSPQGWNATSAASRFMLYTLVSPMPDTRSGERRNKALRTYFLRELAFPFAANFKEKLANMADAMYGEKIRKQVQLHELANMNATDLYARFNISPPSDEQIIRWEMEALEINNVSREMEPSGRYAIYPSYARHWTPYPGYEAIYYTNDKQLPPAHIPAINYHWPWKARLTDSRHIILFARDFLHARMNISTSADSSYRNTEDRHPVFTDLSTENESIVFDKALQRMLEIDFNTGIPILKKMDTPVGCQLVFVDAFERTSPSEVTDLPVNINNQETNDTNSLEDVLVNGTRSLYSFPCFPGHTVPICQCRAQYVSSDTRDDTPSPKNIRSGVTIYTPSLRSRLSAILAGDAALESKRSSRIDLILDTINQAFDAEVSALSLGLQAPSTVWYSPQDRNCDEFADSILGFTNVTTSTTNSNRDVFTQLAQSSNSPFYANASYFAETSNTRLIDLFPDTSTTSDEDLNVLLGHIRQNIVKLDKAKEEYVQMRQDDDEHRVWKQRVDEEAVYSGRLLSEVGFGYLLQSTNSFNVSYYDFKLPEALHLVLRVLVRLQESHVLLATESRHILTCLALYQNNISYYKCLVSSK